MKRTQHSTIRKKQRIGLFGFGVVGKGLYDVLKSTPTLNAVIAKVCIKDIFKERNAPDICFTTSADEIFNDSNITLIVELINDPGAAFLIVSSALKKGIPVVSANKKMIAENFDVLQKLQLETNTALLYEGACCASIPIIRNLEEYYDNDMLSSIRGIINGSSNYILTKMNAGSDFHSALLGAQQCGFAERNPILDIEGYDAASKLVILIAHSFGINARASEFIFSGITSVTKWDTDFAKARQCRIKLVAHAKKMVNGQLAAFILPTLVGVKDELYDVNEEFNGLVMESRFADRQFFKGKGAGALPTAAAVLSDISALGYSYKYEYKKTKAGTALSIDNDYYLEVYVSAGRELEIPKKEFEWIEQSYDAKDHSWVTGIIHARKLYESDWWKEPGYSLLLCNDSIRDIMYHSIQKRSLALAGI